MNFPTAFAALALNANEGLEPPDQYLHTSQSTEHSEPYRDEPQEDPFRDHDFVDIPRERERLDAFLEALRQIKTAPYTTAEISLLVATAPESGSSDPVKPSPAAISRGQYTFPVQSSGSFSRDGKISGPQIVGGKHQKSY